MRRQTAGGLRILNVVDDYTREAATEVARSINATAMTEILDRFAADRGAYPLTITCDNGPEFISDALDQWASDHGVKINFIEPGRPVQNCYIESFNGRMRDECLNQNWFADIDDAHRTITAWTDDYNEEREHGALGMTPFPQRPQLQTTKMNFTRFGTSKLDRNWGTVN